MHAQRAFPSSTRPSSTTRSASRPPPCSSTRCRRCSRSRPGSQWVEIDPRIAPRRGRAGADRSYFASAFFGTTLASLLASAGCDSVVVTGASTSGCVRATAVDALQHGYRVGRPARGGRRPQPGRARGEPVRHRHEVRRRRLARRGRSRTWRSSVAHTLAEKILLAHCDADDVAAGDVVMVRCDVVMANDVTRTGRVPRAGADGRLGGLRPGEGRDGRRPLRAREGRALGELQRRLKEWSRRAGGDVLRPGSRRDRAHAALRGGLDRPGLGDRRRRLAHLHVRRAGRVRAPALGSTDIAYCLALRRVLAGGAATIRVEFTGEKRRVRRPART